MSTRWQILILIVVIITSLTLTKFFNRTLFINNDSIENQTASASSKTPNSLSYQQASLSNLSTVQKIPARKWDILDPKTTAKATIIYSLDDGLPLYIKNSHESHILASLTKLLTSVVVIEDIGIYERIPITQKVIDTQGLSGYLKTGQSYNARDLLKIMLLASSNDAAAAFEEYIGGKEIMARKINKKASEIGLSDKFIVEDASGLSDYNYGTTDDCLKLTKYILKEHPEIFIWTQIREFLAKPTNESPGHMVYNVNELTSYRSFLGGKTGTSEMAGENLISIFNIKDRRVVLITMGSEDRNKDVDILINWIQKAFSFPE